MASLIAVIALAGCDDVAAPEDSKLKSSLAGSWSYEFKDVHERTVKGVVHHAENGAFSISERIYGVENPPEEKSTGEWHVTEGLLKLRTTEIDGRRLGTSQMLYFTCKLGEVSKFQFTCVDQIAKKTYSYTRIANAKSSS